jgi:hypothetical protein
MPLLNRQREADRAPLPFLRFDPDAAAVHFDDPFHNRQPSARPFSALINPVEQIKHFILLTLVDTNPVILHEEYRLSSVLTMANLDFWMWLVTPVLDAVSNEVHQYPLYFRSIHMHDGEVLCYRVLPRRLSTHEPDPEVPSEVFIS